MQSRTEKASVTFGAVAVLFFVGTSRIGATGQRGQRGASPRWRAALKQWGLTQWAVTIGSLPVLLFFFQQFSLVSPLANAVAIPFVSFIVTPLTLIFAILPWPPLLHLVHWLMGLLMVVLEWLAVWPVWQQPAPPLWATLVAMIGVVWLLLPRGFPARWLGIYLMLPAFFLPPPRPASGDAWVDVLDVGQGLAVLVRTSEHALLYDAGPLYSATANAGQRVVVPYLRAVGVGKLDTLVVSHRDKDHSGGVLAVQAAVPVSRTLSSIKELGGELCAAGQAWEWDGVRFSILHPLDSDYGDTSNASNAKPKKTNNLSCVLRVATAGGSVLLTADIEVADEQALLRRDLPSLASDVLLVPHHGGNGSSTPEFIAAVNPSDVVFSAGYRNSFRHPRPEVLERYADHRQWRSDRDGALRILLSDSVGLTAWRRESRRYWR